MIFTDTQYLVKVPKGLTDIHIGNQYAIPDYTVHSLVRPGPCKTRCPIAIHLWKITAHEGPHYYGLSLII